MGKPLDAEMIKDLLAPKPKAAQKTATTSIALPPGRGPLQMVDKQQQCLNSGYYAIDVDTNQRYYKKTQGRCGSPTNYELNGVPYCLTHCLHRMNELLIEAAGGTMTEVRDG